MAGKKKVVITGGSGLLGLSVLKTFVDEGYDVLNVDRIKPREEVCRTVITDLKNLGEVFGALEGADAVVHLAAIPQAYTHANDVTFENNTVTTYNILEAAAVLGINKVVLASSESSYGLCFAKHPIEPWYVPIDEDHPQLPQDPYGLSKVVNEETAKAFNRRTGMQVISLRLGNVIAPETYDRFPSWIHDPFQRDMNVWSYIDARDVATACIKGIEVDGLGAIALNITADDTSMDIKSVDLMAKRFPNVEVRGPIEDYETLLSNKKAKELLGWTPVHQWRDYVKLS